MLSAGGYPVVLYGSLHLPEILPHDDQLHAILRMTHTVLAYVFFATILLHVAAALFHVLIRRDGVFRAMVRSGPRNHRMPAADDVPLHSGSPKLPAVEPSLNGSRACSESST
jgi:cytochrome b561